MENFVTEGRMFCEESIEKVWCLETRGERPDVWDFWDFTDDFAYYVTDGVRLVFQTKNWFIVIGADGVRKCRSREEFVTPDLLCAEESYWNDMDEKDLYFLGEHVVSVKESGRGWKIEFDHLTWTVCPQAGDEPRWWWRCYTPYLNLSHKLKACECGGQAELMFDRHDDYFIRCSACHRAAYGWKLSGVVDEWNRGEHPCDDVRTPSENLWSRKDGKKARIILSKDSRRIDGNRYRCQTVILAYEDAAFTLEEQDRPRGRSVFCVFEISSYNPEYFPVQIDPLPGEDGFTFVSREGQGGEEVMVLTAGQRKIVITARQAGLEVSL